MTEDDMLLRCREGKTSWKEMTGNKIPLHKHGIWEVYGINHCDAVRNVRAHPNVIKIFSALTGSAQLWSSMDRINFKFPGRRYRSAESWAHVDQHPLKSGLVTLQSYVDIMGTPTVDHPGNQFYEGSHIVFEKYREAISQGIINQQKKDWFKVSNYKEVLDFVKSELGELNFPTHVVKPIVPKGGMVLWDSRTIHDPSDGTFFDQGRFVIYISMLKYMEPIFTETQRKKKKAAFEELRSTTHTPCPQTLFSKTGRTYGKESAFVEITSPYALWPSQVSPDDSKEWEDSVVDPAEVSMRKQVPRNQEEKCLFGFVNYEELNRNPVTRGLGVFNMKYDPKVKGLLNFVPPEKVTPSKKKK
jgi:hypothetical protein